ncbi:penicillin-binding transpeptidase domain-containing protein [Bacillus sp. FJAT-27251]|uniref:peptidoglycan D,D-transpeptidase FtsI family protein n=1 Tax=Bacillus sp. FJAT-27251 TaxID=1684142 RepID=UPI0006A7D652|nr:penicillin-binding transpeptidase domain-containing protein [Bacillus sp. FJAT-27251]
MRKNRLMAWLALCMLCMGLLIARLAQIQLISTKSFSEHDINLLEASVRQRAQEIVIDNGRGNFLDRSGRPLVYEKKPVLVLFPFLKHMEWPAEQVALIAGVSANAISRALKDAKEPFAFGYPEPKALSQSEMDQINKLEIPGVFAVEQKFLLPDRKAAQLIGINGENPSLVKKRYGDKEFLPRTLTGLSGLEKSFDEFLIGEGKSRLVYHVDAIGSPLFGINVKYSEPANPFYPVNVKTTIDKGLQEISEGLADRHQLKKGGLVLLDIESNSVLAMVSRPELNTKNPFGDAGVENMMVKQQIPGSVFKTVVAAAAIDYELAPAARRFDCSKKINGEPDLKYQHGILDFPQSFSRSCNRTFADLAKELKEIDSTIMETYAGKLSLTGSVGWSGDIFHTEDFKQFADEESGRVFNSEKARQDDNFAALSAIGQHEVRVSPLAVANMMATIARGGDKLMVRTVEAVEYQNGSKLVSFEPKKLPGETLSPYTVQKLQKLLREVVTDGKGTGRWFNELPYAVAGKSGTAETGRQKEGRPTHSKWFAGYFPYEKPKYALVAVSLDVHDDEGGVNALFADMVKELYQSDQKKAAE